MAIKDNEREDSNKKKKQQYCKSQGEEKKTLKGQMNGQIDK